VKQQVAITGIGAITPIGTGPEELWAGVRAGKSAIRGIERFDPTSFSSQVGAEIAFDPLCYMSPKRARRLDRYSQFALVCAQMALAHAGLTAEEAAHDGAGIYTGSALGGVAFAEEQHTSYVLKGPQHVNPLLALSVFGGAASSNVTIELGLTGPSLAYGNSCAAGMIAIGEAARLIEDGRVPVMLAGGAEAPLAPLTFGAFAMIRVLSTRNGDPQTASRPFDRDRDGFVIAEGGTVLVLESFEHAQARGARIYAELAGYGTTSALQRGTGTGGDRLRERAWLVDRAQRLHRVPRDSHRVGKTRGHGRGERHERIVWSCSWRNRSHGSRDLCAGASARAPARHR